MGLLHKNFRIPAWTALRSWSVSAGVESERRWDNTRPRALFSIFYIAWRIARWEYTTLIIQLRSLARRDDTIIWARTSRKSGAVNCAARGVRPSVGPRVPSRCAKQRNKRPCFLSGSARSPSSGGGTAFAHTANLWSLHLWTRISDTLPQHVTPYANKRTFDLLSNDISRNHYYWEHVK